jgi:NitT/TauT family transport system substrate-binding protein
MPRLRYAMLFLALLLLVTACGGNSGSTSSSGGDQSKSTPFVLGYASTPSISDLPVFMAIDQMKRDGYKASAKEVASFDILFGSLATNQIQLAGGDPILAARAASRGTIKAVVARANNLWAIVGLKQYADCNSWTGKPFGIFSRGAITYIYGLSYIQQACPSAKPREVIIADSALRARALLAGQIVATTLDSTSAPQLLATEDKVQLVSNLGQTLPYGRETIQTNTTVLNNRRPALEAFIAAELNAIRQIYEHPGQVVELARQHLPAQLGDQPQAVADYTLKAKGWCANGGLADDNIAATLQAGQRYGLLDASNSDAGKLLDDAPLKAVLGRIGQSKATTC